MASAGTKAEVTWQGTLGTVLSSVPTAGYWPTLGSAAALETTASARGTGKIQSTQPLKSGFHPVPKEHYFDKTTTAALQSHKRLKSPKRVPANDAAGLLNGAQLHGRTTPLKAQVAPPSSDSAATVRRKAWVAENSQLMNATRDLLGQHGFYGVPPPSDRPSKRVNNDGHQQEFVLCGTGVVLEGEVLPEKKSRGWGTGAPAARYQSTFTRVLEAGEAPVSSGGKPSKMFGRKVNIAPAGHGEVLQHRFDSLISKQYTFDDGRTPAPQT